MRSPILLLATAVLTTLTACNSGKAATTNDAPASPAPTAVSCADAPQLTQRALDDRRQSNELKSDQERIYVGNRANFFSSLAIIADLKCRVTMAEADEALKPAFILARKAEATSSLYEKAAWWGEADFIASRVIPELIKRLPAPPT